MTRRRLLLTSFSVFRSFPSWIGLLALLTLAPGSALAGGPKFIAGVTYFNPGVKGQPVHWANGQVRYFVDPGPLNNAISNSQATAMVDTAATIWNAIPTAAVNLVDSGNLAEDVNGSNVLAGNGVFAQPSDISPTATTTPVGVIFDADGSVIDALNGAGASQPDNCEQNGVLVWIDAMSPDATMAHGIIVLNGRCATTANLLAMMNYQLERAFGRILGLDFSQVNDGALQPGSTEVNGTLGWPVMHPLSGSCGPSGGSCIPNPNVLRFDDIAALNRIYPVTTANQSNFPGKVLTAANTVSIQGTISFRTGQGMQGVNVVARPLDGNGNPLYQYTATFVSGAYFGGNHGNPVTGWTDSQGNRLDRFGSDDPTLQGYFDLSGIPLPPGTTSATYQVSFEAVNPLYIRDTSVGPYLLGSPTPSGTLQTIVVNGLQAGGSRIVNLTAARSAGAAASPMMEPNLSPAGENFLATAEFTPEFESRTVSGPRDGAIKSKHPVSIGTENLPRPLPASGSWTGRLSQVGQSDWFSLAVRGNRIFTVVTQALDETGKPSASKAMPALGVWDGFAQAGTAAAGWAGAQNGIATGETWLQVATSGNDVVRLGIADQRGDGRPDYLYRGWVLYADTVSPARLPAAGGTIMIRGTGFRPGDTVKVGVISAQVISILPTEITALVPAMTGTVTGSLDLEVDDQPSYNAAAVIPGAISYDSASGDGLSIVSAPANQVPINVPQAFSVLALGADGNPAGGVTVLYAVTGGTATLGCGQSTCSVTTTGDGRATLPVTATTTSIAIVTASLTNGASVQAHFYGGAAGAITALTPTLYLAAGSTAVWPVQALAQSGGAPSAGQQIIWKSAAGIAAPGKAVTTNSAGVASATLTVGPLAEGQTASSNACLNGGTTCAAFNAFGARPEFAGLTAVSGASQSIPLTATPSPVTLRVLDMNGHPMAGGAVTINQALYAWAPPCPKHGRCAQAPLLATLTTTATSALDGSVTLTPLTMPGVATSLTGIATTGNTGSLTFTIEQHP